MKKKLVFGRGFLRFSDSFSLFSNQALILTIRWKASNMIFFSSIHLFYFIVKKVEKAGKYVKQSRNIPILDKKVEAMFEHNWNIGQTQSKHSSNTVEIYPFLVEKFQTFVKHIRKLSRAQSKHSSNTIVFTFFIAALETRWHDLSKFFSYCRQNNFEPLIEYS